MLIQGVLHVNVNSRALHIVKSLLSASGMNKTLQELTVMDMSGSSSFQVIELHGVRVKMME